MNPRAILLDRRRWQEAQCQEGSLWNDYNNSFTDPVRFLAYLGELGSALDFATEALLARRFQRALEIGTGPLGVGALSISLDGVSIAAVEPLPRVDLRCRDPALSEYGERLRSRVAYCRAEGEHLPFSDNAFDLVCCLNVLDHCESPQQMLRETWRVLKPKGLFLLTVNTFSYLGRLKFELMRRISPGRPNFVMHPWSFVHASLRDLVCAGGFALSHEMGGEGRLVGASRLSRFIFTKER